MVPIISRLILVTSCNLILMHVIRLTKTQKVFFCDFSCWKRHQTHPPLPPTTRDPALANHSAQPYIQYQSPGYGSWLAWFATLLPPASQLMVRYCMCIHSESYKNKFIILNWKTNKLSKNCEQLYTATPFLKLFIIYKLY